MATLKKTIILNNNTVKNFNGMAVLSLSQENNGVYGTIKAYNLGNYKNLVLGLAQNNKQVLKQNINLINNNSYNFKINNLSLDSPLSCVLVDDTETEIIPIVWANDNYNLKNKIMENFASLKMDELHSQKYVSKVEKKELDLTEMFDITNEDEIENIISEELNNIEIKDEFDKENVNESISEDTRNLNMKENANLISSLKESNEELNPIDEELKKFEFSGDTFYESMSEQIEDLFNKYPAETSLESLIPNSKWVKIDYENDGNFYVLGLIYEDIDLKYICYGVPGKYSDNPPNELDNYSQWLPLNPENPVDGYWVMYQNAITGESVTVDAV